MKKEIADSYSDFLDKRKGLCEYDMKYLNAVINNGDKVLDLGCGTGRHLEAFCNRAQMTGVDISPFMIEAARERVGSCAKLIVGDACSIYGSGYDKIIMMYHTLGSIENRRQLMRDVRTQLAIGGEFIFHVHNRNHIHNLPFLLQRTKGDRLITDGVLAGAKIHFFTKREIKKLAKNTGMKILQIVHLEYPDERMPIFGWKKHFLTGGYIIRMGRMF